MRAVVFIFLSFLLLLGGCSSSLKSIEEYEKQEKEEEQKKQEKLAKQKEQEKKEETFIVKQEPEEINLYDDPILAHLGKSKKEIIELYGEPDCDGSMGGPGGIFLLYEDLGIVFVCAGDGNVVNNLEVFPGTEILGTRVGMTFDEIEKIWGIPKWREYDELDDCYTSCYWMGEIREEECLGELEFYFFAPTNEAPTEGLGVRWKKFWW